MSSRDQHTGDGSINTEEHIGEGGVNRKAVGLFARDALGTGAFELSAISTASGAVLSTTPASISANVNVANVTLNPGPNQIGSVTVANTVGISAPTLFAVVNTGAANGLTSLASGTEVRSLTTILPRTDYIGLMSVSGNVAVSNFPATVAVTQSGTWDEVGINDSGNSITVDGTVSAAQSGSWDVRSVLSVASIYGNVGIIGNPAVDVRSVLSFPTINVVTQAITVNTGMLTLFPGPNQIGSVTVSGTPTVFIGTPTIFAVVNTGAVGNTNSLATLLSGPNQIGSVTVSNFPASQAVTGTFWQATQPVSFDQLASLASGTEVKSLATILNWPATVAVTQSGTWDEVGINDSGNSITIDGNVGVLGLLSLASGTEVRSLATLLNQPPLVASSAYIGLATTVTGAGNQYIGLVTNTLARSMTTSFATIYSGAGNYTLFQPPASQRWFVHNLMVNAMGVSEGTIKSGTALRWPWAGLATYGGFAKTFDNPGLPATAVNDAFVVTLNSGATVSVDVGVHFEA